jgi:hypothetical protein
MKRHAIVAAIAAVCLPLMTACMSSSPSAENADSGSFTPPPYTSAPEPEPAPVEPVVVKSKRDLFAEELEDRGAGYSVANSSKAYKLGKTLCRQFTVNGIQDTLWELWQGLDKSGKKGLVRLTWASVEVICPHHKQPLKKWLDS